MDHAGIFGLVPPILAISLALSTKDVVFSLFSGIAAGALIQAGGNPVAAFTHATDFYADRVSDSWNVRIILFCVLLGGLLGLLAATGADKAFGDWSTRHIRDRRSSMIAAWFFGMIIFFDDYFTNLVGGSSMRPVADRTRVSRAKLAYILDSTSAPACILAPISSWMLVVTTYIRKSEGFEKLGLTDLGFFMRLIPYNLYSIFTIVMVGLVVISNRDFGPMAASEARAGEGKLYDVDHYRSAPGEIKLDEHGGGARWYDMMLPMALLIVTCIIAFPVTTYVALPPGQSSSISDAFRNADASKALFYGSVFTVVATYLYLLLRGVLTVKVASNAFIDGAKAMVPALIVLVMAWTFGHTLTNPMSEHGLGLPLYLDSVIRDIYFPPWLLPFSVFALSSFISFCMGTSWGTFGIMIPLTIPSALSLAAAQGMGPEETLQFALFSVGAVLSGSIFGDHASPLSDTTILAAAGGGCPTLEHFSTQFPYAAFVAGCTGLGIVVGGYTLRPLLAIVVTAILFFAGFFYLSRPTIPNEPPKEVRQQKRRKAPDYFQGR